MNDRYPYLIQFISGYFHEEWATEGADTSAIIERFIKHNRGEAEAINRTLAEARALLAQSRDDELLTRELWRLGLRYSPAYHHLTHRAWLELVIRDLETAT